MSQETIDFARRIRIETLRMNTAHLGSALCIADILAVIYGATGGAAESAQYTICTAERVLPPYRFILSKGHGVAALYAALALRGIIPIEELATFGQDGSRLMAHASHEVPGVLFSTGSLGHGLPFACGSAYAGKLRRDKSPIIVLMSDGEFNEGSNWEAILFAAHHKLDNLLVIIDSNGLQGFGKTYEVLNTEPIAEKMQAFGWMTCMADGHEHAPLRDIIENTPWRIGKPSCLIARTIKGKGAWEIEGKGDGWMTPLQREAAIERLKAEVYEGKT